MQNTSARRLGHARHFTDETDTIGRLAVDTWQRRHQRLGVGVVRSGEHLVGRTQFHDPTEVEHGDAVGQIPNDAQVVGDEQVGDVLRALQIDEQIEDRRLHRHVER